MNNKLDLKMQTIPAAHLAYLDLMKRDGWEIEDETALRTLLRHQIDRREEDEPGALN